MRCFSQKELISLFYGEVGRKKEEFFRSHICECARCSRAYSKMKAFLCSIEPATIEISQIELDRCSDLATEKVLNPIFARRRNLRDILDFLKQWITLIFPRPCVVGISSGVCAFFILASLWGWNYYALNREFDIFEIQMELTCNIE